VRGGGRRQEGELRERAEGEMAMQCDAMRCDAVSGLEGGGGFTLPPWSASQLVRLGERRGQEVFVSAEGRIV
jgi:hypothetical protein